LGEHVVTVHLNQLGLKGRENELKKNIIMGVILEELCHLNR